MKNVLFSCIALFLAFATSLNAQSGTEAEIRKMWDDAWKAYSANDEAKMWSMYAENATEIYPDGSILNGLANIKAGLEQFKGMLEGTPSWSVSAPTIQLIAPDYAMIYGDVTSDIKLKGGQQIGGKMKMAILIHKTKGQWLIEFDSQTPVMDMSGAGK